MGAASSRRLQPHSALQGIEEEVQTEGTDDIDGNDQGQILGNEIPVMRIAKLRHNPKARQGDQGEVQHIQFVDHSSDISLHGKQPFRRGEWKPDAPEFIPIPQQRVAMQQVERQQDLGVKETQRHGLDDERDLKKARKRGRRSRKEAMSRRKGTKSEPAGIGLTTDIDHSSYLPKTETRKNTANL